MPTSRASTPRSAPPIGAYDRRTRHGDITHVEDLLWQTAMAIEQKGILAAANNLRELQALITAAMAAHAPQQVIDQLLQRYNQAMQRYLEAMAENAGRTAQKPPPNDANAKTLGFDDLQKMMQAIQQLSASGNREQAAQMLAALQNMLENMRMAKSGSGQGSQQNSELNQAIQQYGDLMGEQRALMDKTLRQQQGKGDPKDGGAEGLARQQDELRQKLNKSMQKLGKMGDGLGKAGQAMDQAQKSLSGKDLSNARNAQENALAQMRQGADALAKQMQGSDPMASKARRILWAAGRLAVVPASSCRTPMFWRGRATFCRSCAAAPASAAARPRNWITSTACSRNSEAGHPRDQVHALQRPKWHRFGQPARPIRATGPRSGYRFGSARATDVRQCAVMPGIVHAIADHEIIADDEADMIGVGDRIGTLLVQRHHHPHAGRARRFDQRHRFLDRAPGIQHAIDHQHMVAGNLFGRARDHRHRARHPLVAIGTQPQHFDRQIDAFFRQRPHQIGREDKAADQNRHGDVGLLRQGGDFPGQALHPDRDLFGTEKNFRFSHWARIALPDDARRRAGWKAG